LPVEAKQIREHHWKPYVEKLFKKKVFIDQEMVLRNVIIVIQQLRPLIIKGKIVSHL
jgi:hypothetical protein